MKTIVTLLVSLAVLAACTTKTEKENIALRAENDSLKAVNVSLKEGNAQLTISVDGYEELLEEIEGNLASIDETSAMIRKLGSESESKDADIEQSIKDHIANISALLENSRLKIISLDKNLSKLRKGAGDQSEKILELDERMKALASEVLNKETEMTTLQEEIAGLEVMLREEMTRSAALQAILNRAYFVKGTAKELKDMGVIKKEGGFIGLGRVKVLNAKASDTLFTQLAKDKINSIDLSCKEATLITTHPGESYAFEGDDMVTSMLISDTDAFWKNTNYLVIEVEK